MLSIKKVFLPVIFSVLFFYGCSFFNEPVREFFIEYTETAAVGRHEYQEAVAVDREGIDCLSSGQDKEILLYLRNPQLYDLNLTIKSDAGVAGDSTFSISQNQDKSRLTIVLREDFLTSLECGGIFSPTVSLVEKKSLRKFDDYSFKLKINSVPPSPQGAVVLVTGGDSTPKKYVLCFNLPDHSDVKGIHRDIKTLTIESNGSVKKRTIYLTPDSSGNIAFAADESGTALSDVKSAVADGDITENNQDGAAALGFTPGENPVYIFTEDVLVPKTNNITYKITLEDEGGLSASASTSVYSQKLSVPSATAVCYEDGERAELENAEDAAVTQILQDEDGAGYVRLIRPQTLTTGAAVSSCTVAYEIYGGASFDTLLGKGSVSSTKEIPVPPVECKIKAHAENPAYVSSDFAIFHVKPVCKRIYVDKSGSDSGWGTRARPVNKISKALDSELFADKTDSENTIILLSDMEDGNISITEQYCFTLTSQNSSGAACVHTVTPASSGSGFMSLGGKSSVVIENLCIRDFAGASGGGAFAVADAILNLKNVELTGNTAPSNGGVLYLSDSNSLVVLSGETFVTSGDENCGYGAYIADSGARLYVNEDSYLAQNCPVYLYKDAMLYASALCTAEKIACIRPSEYPEDTAVTKVKLLEASDPNALNGDFCNLRFTVAKNPEHSDLEYYVVYSDSDRCGILAKGTSAEVTAIHPDKVIFHQLYMKGVYLTFYATDGSGNRLKPQESSIKVKLRSDVLSSGNASNEYVQHTIPPQSIESLIEDGKIDGEQVTVELSVKVSGIVYSVEEPIVKASVIEDTASLANAIAFINTLDDSSRVTLEISADITVTDSTPLLGTSDHKFNGTFDGHGHTITLNKSAQYRTAAIADYVGPNGVIKNVVIKGNYSNTGNTKASIQTGGVVAENEGLIINCVNYLNITVKSTNDAGGIAFVNRGKIVNCANFGDIANNTTAYWAGVYGKVGGISGRNDGNGLIENCFNCGKISSTCPDNVLVATNGLPGAITGSQSGTATGRKCYWKDGCVKRGSSTNTEAYNSYAFKNSLLSFFWTYGYNGNSIDSSKKSNETFIYSCGTFADASSEIVAGTAQNSERDQTLTYTGSLLSAMNAYVAKNKNYNFNGADIELLEWEADSTHEDYPKLKF